VAGFLQFSMVVWSVDKGGQRTLGAEPILFRLRTPLKDFTVPTQEFRQGLWAAMEELMVEQVYWTFMARGGATGPWAGLSEKYAKRKAAKYPGSPLLWASGAMMSSFFGGTGHVFEQGPLGMKWGTLNPLAGYHQRGHGSPTPLPQRRLWDPPETFGGNLESTAVRYCAERYREQGFRIGKEAGVSLSRPQASLAGKLVLGGGYGAPLSAPSERLGL
jgi:hypothetical protein